MKEYGGYLPLELSQKKEYFYNIQENSLLRLNSGRSTFYCAAIDSKIKKIYLPYLNCQNSVDPFVKAGVKCEFYWLNVDLTPKEVELEEDAAILWVNYYGNATDKQKHEVISKYSKLIIDNCHAFYSLPVIQDGVYNCYSARKFFGVADGAYLIKKDLESYPCQLIQGHSAENSLFLMKTIEMGTDCIYPDSIKNEDRIAKKISRMSLLTQKILCSIDYDEVKNIRLKNFIRLHNNLKTLNEFNVNVYSSTHMYYPLLVSNDSLREKLIENRIYTPTWWRHVPEICHDKGIETKLAKYMLMIPMDQRYSESDMDDISNIIKRNL